MDRSAAHAESQEQLGRLPSWPLLVSRGQGEREQCGQSWKETRVEKVNKVVSIGERAYFSHRK